MGEIITIANQKGGVGKTSTSTALAWGLGKKGYHVLLIDTDPQGNASDTFGFDPTQSTSTIFSILSKETDISNAIIKTEYIDLIPGDIRMSAADMQFVQQGREYLLKKALNSLKEQYNYIIIDTPPALGIITINAFTAADTVIIPMIADRYSMQGLGQLAQTIGTVREYSNPHLKIDGILLTRFNSRTILGRDIQDTLNELSKNLNTKVYQSTIRQSIALPESQTQRESIFSYAPTSTTAEDYIAFLKEFLKGRS